MRGWQEPAHVRAAVRRAAVREEESADSGTETARHVRGRGGIRLRGRRTGWRPTARSHGPDARSGRRRPGKNHRQRDSDLTHEEMCGLECVLLVYGRPAVLINGGNLASVPSFWNLLEDLREDMEMAQRGVGRIELLGHPEYDWAGHRLPGQRQCADDHAAYGRSFHRNRDDDYHSVPALRPGWTIVRLSMRLQRRLSRPLCGRRPRNTIWRCWKSNGRKLMALPDAAVAGRGRAAAPGSRPVYLIGYPDSRRSPQ